MTQTNRKSESKMREIQWEMKRFRALAAGKIYEKTENRFRFLSTNTLQFSLFRIDFEVEILETEQKEKSF